VGRRGTTRATASALAALLLPVVAACGQDAPETVRAAGPGAVVDTGPALPARGPFRRTARGAYRWRVEPVSRERLGSSHRDGCPVAVADLRLVTVSHVDASGGTRQGQLVVHRDVAADVVEVFRTLHAAGFPLARVETVERYGADDDRSMAADNTSAYNCRRVTGGSRWSEHAYGTAIDVNPVENPYVRGSTVAPPAGRAYLDRSDVRPGMAVRSGGPDGVLVRAFAAVGWGWGGDFTSLKDWQHFSLSGR
jgi:hypothetical protein